MVRSGPLTKTPVVVVAGPTASGKSELSIHLAQDLNGEIINVDSVQVYREADIGSAKLLEKERGGVPHHLIDSRTPNEQYNAAVFLADATRAAVAISAAGKTPVLCGGTGLYTTIFFHGLAELPQANEEIREKLEKLESEKLYSMLIEKDPELAAKLHVNDRLRIIRALETIEEAGVSVSALHRQHDYKGTNYVGLMLVLCRQRSELYARINERSRRMVEQGLVEETSSIIQKYGDDSPVLSTLGYSQAKDFLAGRIAREEISGAIAQFTRRFAKRQMTYWRNEPLKRGWKVRPDASEQAIELIGEKPKSRSEEQRHFRVFDLSYDELLERVRKRLSEPFPTNEVWYIKAS